MSGKLENHVAIVTGAAQGVGEGVAHVLAEHGAKVVVADIRRDGGEGTATALREAGYDAIFSAVDLADDDSMCKLVADTADHYGRIDILANVAGIYPVDMIEGMSTEQWDKVLRVNLTAPFVLTRECAPHMKKLGRGRIIVTSSITGNYTAYPGMSHYAATKAGVTGFIRAAATEFAPYKITVNSIDPGGMLTPGLKQLCTPQDIDVIAKQTPLQRIGVPRDVGNLYAFLASDDAEYITGTSIRCDGGMALPESAALADLEEGAYNDVTALDA